MICGTSEILLSLRSIMLSAGNIIFTLNVAVATDAEVADVVVDSVSSLEEMLLKASDPSPQQ
jgi:hypothetical protein